MTAYEIEQLALQAGGWWVKRVWVSNGKRPRQVQVELFGRLLLPVPRRVKRRVQAKLRYEAPINLLIEVT